MPYYGPMCQSQSGYTNLNLLRGDGGGNDGDRRKIEKGSGADI